ncbi:MAG: ABC transporter substrate-binding protein [Roseivirga sp.]
MKNTNLNFKSIAMVVIGAIAIGIFVRQSPKSPDPNKKSLVTVCNAKIDSLDPVQVSSTYANREASKIYEGLMEYDYLKRPYELIPNLAEAMPTVSTDGLTYIFKLKEGVKFHDNACFPAGQGRELVAEDFVYSIKRIADPKSQSPWFSLLAGKIKGLDAWREQCIQATQADYAAPVAGLQAQDRYTLRFTLNQPWPQFLDALAMQFTYAVPQEAVEHYGKEFINHPVGTGPFMTEAFNPQANKVIYRKNPTFREKYYPTEAAEAYQHMLADAGKRLPLVDEVVMHIIPEEQPRWLKFKKGQVDIIDISNDNIFTEVIYNKVLLPELQQKGFQLFYEPEVNTSFFVINNGHPLFKSNLKLRQALSMAFDRERYNELFYNNTAVLAQSIVPPGLAGYQADYVNSNATYNPEKAKQLLVEAGYPEGKGLPVITLDVNAQTTLKQKGEFFQKCMEAIGVQVQVVPNLFPELQKKMHQKETMMHAISWSADYPDAETFFQLLYKSDQSMGIGLNFSDPAFNALYEKATSMSPSAERTTHYEQLNKIAAESVPAIYIAHPIRPVLYQGWVKNYLISDFHYGSAQYINIDLEQQRALKPKL